MSLQQWLHAHIGKKVVASHPKIGAEVVEIRNVVHADILYGLYDEDGFSFSTHDEDSAATDSL